MKRDAMGLEISAGSERGTLASIQPIGNPHMAPEEIAANRKSVGEFSSYFTRVIDERRERPGDDFISMMVAKSDDGENPLSRDEMLAILNQLLAGGIETTAKMITSAWELLIRNPDQMRM